MMCTNCGGSFCAISAPPFDIYLLVSCLICEAVQLHSDIFELSDSLFRYFLYFSLFVLFILSSHMIIIPSVCAFC